MALLLIATVGASNANSYATVEAADEAASFRIGAGGWSSLSPDQKVQALVTATKAIDRCEGTPGFLGERATDTQALAWPRSGTDDWDEDELPAELVDATIELAISYTGYLNGTVAGDPLNQNKNDAGLKRQKIDVLEKEWFEARTVDATSVERFPDAVQQSLDVLLRPTETSGWGSATVERGS